MGDPNLPMTEKSAQLLEELNKIKIDFNVLKEKHAHLQVTNCTKA